MKKWILSAIAAVLFFSVPVPLSAEEIPAANPPDYVEPAYAKWGRLAVFETGKRYPAWNIVDYLYVGKTSANADSDIQTFKLWLRKDGREMGVIVTITITKSGVLKRIAFRETSQ
ncbi:DUF3889 domain-containing protein [Fictibacillus iocasae]|uniref:DUF3889 domain-containing protein n=1 Tax=Fictibacillus iocasae TaxID=2715437 RepID=A0ABW2NPM0_9BACL